MKRILMLTAAASLAACATVEETETTSTFQTVQPSEMIDVSEAAQSEDATSLRNISSILSDAESLYERSVEIVDAPELKDEMAELARQRAAINELFLARLDAMEEPRPIIEGELFGPGHRLYLNLASVFDNNNDAVLDAAVAREENLLNEALQAVQGAESSDLSEGTKEFINFHIERPQGIRAGHDHVNVLRARYEEN